MRLMFIVMMVFVVAALGSTGCPRPKDKTPTPTPTTPAEPGEEPGEEDKKKPMEEDKKKPMEEDKKKPMEEDKKKGSVKVHDVKDVEIEAGKDAKVELKIERKDFAEVVTLKIDNSKLPEGVTVKAPKSIAKDKSDATITFEAGEEAKGAGELVVTVSGKDIPAVTTKISVKVSEKNGD